MSTPINTDITIDYFSVIHRNLYRMRIDPEQRCIIKKYLRLIENELDDNPGSPPVFWPYQHDPKPTYANKCQTLAEIFHRLTSAEEGANKNLANYKEFRASTWSPSICPRRRRSMKQTLHLQYAMETWAFTLQISSTEEQNPSPFTLLKRTESSLRRSSGDFPLAGSLLACSRTGAFTISDWVTFRCYIDVGRPLLPRDMFKLLRHACMNADADSYDISDPLNYGESVIFPFVVEQDKIDVALERIRHNPEQIISDVSIGQHFTMIVLG
ncbi:TPA: hypothetical protein ACH3X2_004024 [Trebouxia sp. C0005]